MRVGRESGMAGKRERRGWEKVEEKERERLVRLMDERIIPLTLAVPLSPARVPS